MAELQPFSELFASDSFVSAEKNRRCVNKYWRTSGAFLANYQLVSIQKWPFSAISASICGIVCAAYNLYASAQSLDFLDFAKNWSFLNWKHELMPIVGDFHFRMGTS
jgi:hypothetical protein